MTYLSYFIYGEEEYKLKPVKLNGYYNKILRRFVFDVYLINFIVSTYLAAYLMDRFILSDEDKMKCLARDIISQSRRKSEFLVL